jgi:hypothetical protein
MLLEEWANRIAAMLNGRRREAAVLLHEFFELDQHLVVRLRWSGLNLQTAKGLLNNNMYIIAQSVRIDVHQRGERV